MEDEARATTEGPDGAAIDRGITRQGLLVAGAGGALALGAGGVVSPERAAAAIRRLTAGPKRGGTLRVGIAGGSADDDFDAAHINFPSETTRDQVFYETLTYLDGKGLLRRLLTACADHGLAVSDLEVEPAQDDLSHEVTVRLELRGRGSLSELVDDVEAIEGVKDVSVLTGGTNGRARPEPKRPLRGVARTRAG